MKRTLYFSPQLFCLGGGGGVGTQRIADWSYYGPPLCASERETEFHVNPKLLTF